MIGPRNHSSLAAAGVAIGGCLLAVASVGIPFGPLLAALALLTAALVLRRSNGPTARLAGRALFVAAGFAALLALAIGSSYAVGGDDAADGSATGVERPLERVR